MENCNFLLFFRIEVPGATKCICAFTPTSPASGPSSNVSNWPSIFAVCADGSYHKFNYDEIKRAYQRDIYHMFLEATSWTKFLMLLLSDVQIKVIKIRKLHKTSSPLTFFYSYFTKCLSKQHLVNLSGVLN